MIDNSSPEETTEHFLLFPNEERRSSWGSEYYQSPSPISPRMDDSPKGDLVINPFYQERRTSSEMIEIVSSPEVEILPTPEKKPIELIDLASPEIIPSSPKSSIESSLSSDYEILPVHL